MSSSALGIGVAVFVLGLCLGSFLNVVITRLPVMLMHHWRHEARTALELPIEHSSRFNLATPGSLCPRCEQPIAWHDNLPLIGWIKRRGRCANCQTTISPQYPLIELMGGLLALAVTLLHGLSISSLFIYAACMTLLALAVIDFRTYLLPDVLTLPLLWAGLLYQLVFQPFLLTNAVVGAMAGYLILWSFFGRLNCLRAKKAWVMGISSFWLLWVLGSGGHFYRYCYYSQRALGQLSALLRKQVFHAYVVLLFPLAPSWRLRDGYVY